MKDHITFGAIAGAIGGAFGLMFSYSMFLLGVSPISSINLASSFVVKDIMNLSTAEVIFALIVHFSVAALFGTLMMNILMKTGKDYWVVKGIMTGALFCLIAHSYLIPLMRTDALVRNMIFNAPSFGTMITAHAIIGLVTAYIIAKYHHWNKVKV